MSQIVKISQITNCIGLRRILANIGWLTGDNILRMGVGLFVGVWVARYLGPEQYGTLNYAIAIVGLFSAFSKLGLDGIVVRNIVRDPSSKDEILGTACVLKIIGGLFAFLLAITTVVILRSGDILILWIVCILSAGMVWHALDVIEFWFQSTVASKYTVFARTTAFTLFSLTKIILILMQAPLIAFAWVALAEVIAGAFGLAVVYRFTGQYISHWKFKIGKAYNLLKDSWPLIVSGLAIMVYMRIDQVMLGQMTGDLEVGIYSAALKISEVWYFIPTVIATSVYPSIIKAKEQSNEAYYSRLQLVYNSVTWLGIFIAISVSYYAGAIIQSLFGVEYARGGPVLAIHIWAGVFVFQGVARGNWIITENLQRYSLIYITVGCFVNVVLNLLLIPRYQSIGAAYATLVSQAIVALVAPALFSKTRISSKMLLKSFVWGRTTGP